ncbi:MAG: glycosyltransferase family 4 protein [Clostridia bacterium]|nr:glycosyltransferase family 4 protein [Clostridia bacterium]
MKLLILVNHYNTLRIFRRELLQRLSALGHELIVSLPETDEENRKIIESYGCSIVIEPAMERRGNNPVKDLALLKNYIRLIKQVKPDKVITYTIKCNIYGAAAAKLCRVPCYCNVTGLGSTFQQENFTKQMVSAMYKLSMNKAKKVIFENIGNRDTFVRKELIQPEQAVVMAGAGVNIEEFYAAPYPPEDEIRFIFVGRIMAEKGVDELFYAIQKLKSEYDNLQFDFIGWYEDDYEATVNELQEKGFINFYGFQPNVKPFIEKAHCVILPSWHEGMSNTLLEGASMGRPLITNNIHGCMEAVEEGKNGFLAKLKDKESLYEALKRFVELPYAQKRQMGIYSREYVTAHFEKGMVVQKTIEVIFEQEQTEHTND